MRQLMKQLKPSQRAEFEQFINIGKARISRNLEWCGFTLQDFTNAYIRMQDGRQVNALIRTVLTMDCQNNNTMIAALGMQEFTQDAMDKWLVSEMDTILDHFEQHTAIHQQAS